jgi:hypothetical protein
MPQGVNICTGIMVPLAALAPLPRDPLNCVQYKRTGTLLLTGSVPQRISPKQLAHSVWCVVLA